MVDEEASAMSNPPWMQFYIDDYLSDTQHLTTIQHGAYLLLIMHYWKKGSLPTDDRQLAVITRLKEREWRQHGPILAALFGPNWSHKRVDFELKKAKEKSAIRAEAGKRGGDAKSLKKAKPRIAKASDLPEQKATVALASSPDTRLDSSLCSESKPSSKKLNPKKDDPKTTLLEVLSPEIADGVIEHRRAMKRPLTALAAKGLAKGFAATGQPDAAATMMVERGWQGFKVEWFENARAGPQSGGRANGMHEAMKNFVRKHGDFENDDEKRRAQGAAGDVQFLPGFR